MYCRRLSHYDGTMSEKIVAMISDKMKKKREEHMDEILKSDKLKPLIKARDVYIKAKAAEQKAREHFSKLENKFGFSWYDKKWSVRGCFCPAKVYKKLDDAQKLSALNKREEARKIWDKLIEQYELV